MIQVYEGDGVNDLKRDKALPIWGIRCEDPDDQEMNGLWLCAIKPSTGLGIWGTRDKVGDGMTHDQASNVLLVLRRGHTIREFLCYKVRRLPLP